MNRRSLLALFGGGAVAAPNMTLSDMAKATQIPLVLGEPVAGNRVRQEQIDSYYDSTLRIQMEAAEYAQGMVDYGQPPYAHMKSWGRGFRMSVIAREKFIRNEFDRRMRSDASFSQLIMNTVGWK